MVAGVSSDAPSGPEGPTSTPPTSTPATANVVWHPGEVPRGAREQLNGHAGLTVWFTGLSGSGKSTISRKVEALLHARGCRVYTLDGDNIRHGLSQGLTFSDADRAENIRRVGEVCRLFNDAGMLTLAALVSPLRADRQRLRSLMGPDFVEVFVNTSLATCEARDPKGLYKRARAGEIGSFTGVSAPYEPPESPDVELRTEQLSADESAARVVAILEARGALKR